MQAKQFMHGETKIVYTLRGAGKPVVLLHGFGEDDTIWDDVAKTLSAHCLCIIPKIPGSGGTNCLPGHPSIHDFAEVIHQLLRYENIASCTFIGHSMGGYIALAFAQKYPEMLRALCLFHSSAYADDAMKVETRQKAIQLIREKGSMVFLKTAIPGLFHDTEKHKNDIESLLEKATQFTPEALIQYYEAMINRTDTTAVLEKILVPVYFILGEHDKAVPFKHGLQQSHLPKHAHLTILRQTGHMGMIEEPEKSTRTLLECIGE
ncbi:MAG: alpha/beta hydrolase [Ferruginibacter sp.]|nr:alpha/beta hydrolase [Ferruginibacter sp.]